MYLIPIQGRSYRFLIPYTGGMIVIIKLSMSPMNADTHIPVDHIKNEPILSGSRQLYFGSTTFGSLHRHGPQCLLSPHGFVPWGRLIT